MLKCFLQGWQHLLKKFCQLSQSLNCRALFNEVPEMKNSVKFSFIVPVYNAEKYVQDCIKSILDQTYKNYEVIIVDDGSSDASVEKIESVIQNISCCQLIKNEHGGVCKARNTGLLHATGQYICFVDADDLVFKDYLQKIYDAVIYCNPDVIYFYAKYGIDNRVRSEFSHKLLKLDKKDLQVLSEASLYRIPEMDERTSKFYNINSFSSWGQVYKRELYTDNHIFFVEGITLSEDGLANLELLYYTKTGAVVCQQLYNYRMGNTSATRSFKTDLVEMFDRRDIEVKKIIRRLYNNSDSYIKKYYSSLIYQMRVIFENCIFNPVNPASRKEKDCLFMEVINKPDYAEAIKVSGSDYLLKEDRIYLEFAKQRSSGIIIKYINRKNRKKIVRQVIKRCLRVLRLRRF